MSQNPSFSSTPGDDLSQSRSSSPVTFSEITILHMNIRGFLSHLAELEIYIDNLPNRPSIITLNETFLDKSVEHIQISGYLLVSRRDRTEREGGGIALFCLHKIFDLINHLSNSIEFERSWFTLHTDLDPILLCS